MNETVTFGLILVVVIIAVVSFIVLPNKWLDEREEEYEVVEGYQ